MKSTIKCLGWNNEVVGLAASSVRYRYVAVLRSRSHWSRNYSTSGAGAEMIFLINIFCSQFWGMLGLG